MKSRKRRGSLLMSIGILLLIGALILTLYNIHEANQADESAQHVLTALQDEIEDSDSGSNGDAGGTDAIPG